jgi:hypothetical protein
MVVGDPDAAHARRIKAHHAVFGVVRISGVLKTKGPGQWPGLPQFRNAQLDQ